MRRRSDVRVGQNLPWYYEGLPIFEALNAAEDVELVDTYDDNEAMMLDAYVVTAGEEATTRREREIHIRADRTREDLEFRRSRIIARYMMKPPFTIRWMHRQLETLLGGDFLGLERINGVRTLVIRCANLTEAQLHELRVLIEAAVTLSIDYVLHQHVESLTTIYLGAAAIPYDRARAYPPPAQPADAPLYIAATAADYQNTRAKGVEP